MKHGAALHKLRPENLQNILFYTFTNYSINGATTKPSATAMAMASTPGIKNGWLNTRLPIRVEPVSSICTAPNNVGYVGSTKSADTAAKDAIMIYTEPVFSGVMPNAKITAGTKACVVAAWLYNNVLAKKNATANKNGYAVTMLEARALISGI